MKLRTSAIIPQIKVITTDSTKNCKIISLFKAQIAFLIPISLVLSVTDTIIIFITQIPQINNDNPQIKSKNAFIILVVCSICLTNSAKEEISNPAVAALDILNFFINI